MILLKGLYSSPVTYQYTQYSPKALVLQHQVVLNALCGKSGLCKRCSEQKELFYGFVEFVQHITLVIRKPCLRTRID